MAYCGSGLLIFAHSIASLTHIAKSFANKQHVPSVAVLLDLSAVAEATLSSQINRNLIIQHKVVC